MKNIFVSVFIMSIVLSREEIYAHIPIGASKEQAANYLLEIGEGVEIYSRAIERAVFPPYPWIDGEAEYLNTWVPDVRAFSWLPSVFGEKPVTCE